MLKSVSDNDRLAWPILLLLMTVLVPSMGVVWMMREAVRNERLATSQRLREAYETQLESASQTIQDRWETQLEKMLLPVDQQNPAGSFADIISQHFFDSALICDDQGHIVYPEQPVANESIFTNPGSEWAAAEHLEFTQRRFAKAAEAYARLSREAPNKVQRARARQAQVRCLVELGEQSAAIEVLQMQRQENGLRDEQGRSFAAAAELRMLEILDRETDLWQEVAKQLSQRLGNYQDDFLTTSQRRFLMEELRRFNPKEFKWPTQDAEKLAAEAVAAYDAGFTSPQLQKTPLPELWSLASPDGRVVGLFRTATIRDQLLQLADSLPLPSGVIYTVTSPQETSQNLMEHTLGENLGGWRMGLLANSRDPFDETSQQRQAVHAWIALLVIAVTCVLAWLLANALRRRLQLAKLKNDLVATVSHELKTPLASIRLLVDTLLEADRNPSNENSHVDIREYLELIAQENARLTRLIDNFLTFSRIERGMQRFDFQVIDGRHVIQQAAEVFREHYDNAEYCLQINEGQPSWVCGDQDALVTAVVNLLENAWKYSGEQKQIVLSTEADDDHVTISVRDNGIGLSDRASGRIFDRFYQVDQRVARTQGGCGLGLSIVQAIMQAHGGKVHVQSQPKKGSTFTLCLPMHHEEITKENPLAAGEGDR